MYLSEYLPRLEQISVSVDIPQENDIVKSLALRENRIVLETAGQGINGVQNGTSNLTTTTSHDILLPVHETWKLAGAKITKLACRDAVVSLTLSLNFPVLKTAPAPFTALTNTNGVWSVDDLLKKTPRNSKDVSQFRFTCVYCDTVVVDSNSHKFIDMPLEYWHEMMDFWHCHKPHEDHHDHHDKNYDGKLNPKPGFVHIGSSYILLPRRKEQCLSCGKSLGKLDGDALKINKWNLHLQYGAITETYPPYSFVYFAILDRVNSSGVRKFTVKLANSKLAYNVWVTSVGLDVSYGNKKLSQCLKLLYAIQTDSKDDDLLEVPEEVWVSLETYFSENNALLPKHHQTVELMDGEVNCKYSVCYLAPQGSSIVSN